MADIFKNNTDSNKISDQKEKDLHNLIIHNSKTDILQLYNLRAPYMILFETCNNNDDTYIMHQLTPSEHVYSYPLKSSLLGRPQHQHSFIELMYVLSGTVTNHIESQTFSYSAGQCCVMNKNIHHCEEISGDYRAVFLMFQDDYLIELLREYQEYFVNSNQQEIIHPIYQLLEYMPEREQHFDKVYLDYFPCVCADTAVNELKSVLNTIVMETISPSVGSQFFIKGYFARFFELLNDTSRYSMECVRSDSHGQEYLFGKIVHIMEASHGRTSRNELSRLLHYNGEYLNRIVKKYIGKTIQEYGKSIALETVRKTLLDTDKSVSEIITEMGFSNHNHFYQMFKNAYGDTPLEYRVKQRKKQIPE